jgi:hypothetical protein
MRKWKEHFLNDKYQNTRTNKETAGKKTVNSISNTELKNLEKIST